MKYNVMWRLALFNLSQQTGEDMWLYSNMLLRRMTSLLEVQAIAFWLCLMLQNS